MSVIRLNLVLDTSAILNCTSEMFEDITSYARFGSLPQPVRIVVPYVVIGELRGHMRSNKPDVRRNAAAAVNYFAQLSYNHRLGPNSHVHLQTRTQAEVLKRTFFPSEANPYTSLNDSEIVMCCVDLHYATNTETWLIGDDRQLLARCVRSGLHGMTIATLKLAIDLEPYRRGHRLGNDYHVWNRTSGDTVTISFGDGSQDSFKACDTSDRRHAYQRIQMRKTVPQRHGAITDPTETEPDGVTLAPWERGKSLTWDATRRCTVALSYLSATSKEAGAAASQAERGKVVKYRTITPEYLFCPLAFETLGPWGPEAHRLMSALARKIRQESGEKRTKDYIYQRISIELQRANAMAVLGTAPPSANLDEIFSVIRDGGRMPA